MENEEILKTYKSIIEKTKSALDKNISEFNEIDLKNALEDILLNLNKLKKEKDEFEKDEDIRKKLIHFFSEPSNTSFEYWEATPKAKVLEWLNKQKRDRKSLQCNKEDDEKMRIMTCKFLDDLKYENHYSVDHKKDIEDCIAWINSKTNCSGCCSKCDNSEQYQKKLTEQDIKDLESCMDIIKDNFAVISNSLTGFIDALRILL